MKAIIGLILSSAALLVTLLVIPVAILAQRPEWIDGTITAGWLVLWGAAHIPAMRFVYKRLKGEK